MVNIIFIIYQLAIAFSFGSVNAITICLITSKGIQQGFLDSLFNPLKRILIALSFLIIILSFYIKSNIILYLITAYLINTIIFGIYLAKKWGTPEPNQMKILQASAMLSLILWYFIIVLNFLSL